MTEGAGAGAWCGGISRDLIVTCVILLILLARLRSNS